jgi:hypothetical protein
MPFHPEALTDAALKGIVKAIVKAMSKAAPGILGHDLPLHQARELLARGLGYAHWHEAQQRAGTLRPAVSDPPPADPHAANQALMLSRDHPAYGDDGVGYQLISLDELAFRTRGSLKIIQKRPGMYTDLQCPNALLEGVIMNAVEEGLAGFGTTITIRLDQNDGVSVRDEGRGMPCGPSPQGQNSVLHDLFTSLHSPRSAGAYADAPYTAGLAVVTALSRRLQVTVKREDMEYRFEAKDGFPSLASGSVYSTPVPLSARSKTGTEVAFVPKDDLFEQGWDLDRLDTWLMLVAYACPQLTLVRLRPDGQTVRWGPGHPIQWSEQALEAAWQDRARRPFAGLPFDLTAPAQAAAAAGDTERLIRFHRWDPKTIEAQKGPLLQALKPELQSVVREAWNRPSPPARPRPGR